MSLYSKDPEINAEFDRLQSIFLKLEPETINDNDAKCLTNEKLLKYVKL